MDKEVRNRDDDPNDSGWSVRVSLTGGKESRVIAGKSTFSVGGQARFSEEGIYPSAVEYLLGALGADLVSGFHLQAKKRGIVIDALESVVRGRLSNPLVFLEVVGAEGRPGFDSIAVDLFVSSEASETTLQDAWRAAVAVSPLVSSLERGLKLTLTLRVAD